MRFLPGGEGDYESVCQGPSDGVVFGTGTTREVCGTFNRFRLMLSTYPMMPHCGSAQHPGSLELMQLLQSCHGRLSALVARLVSSGARPVRSVKFRMMYSV